MLVICKIFPTNIPCFPRRLQRNTFRLPRPLEDVLKRLQDVFAIRLPKTSSRRLREVFEDVFKLCLQDVLEDKTMLH